MISRFETFCALSILSLFAFSVVYFIFLSSPVSLYVARKLAYLRHLWGDIQSSAYLRAICLELCSLSPQLSSRGMRV